MAQVISLASQKGGVGKTTTAIHLSTAFALGGYRVLLIDLDPQGSVKASLGYKKHIEKGTFNLFVESASLEETVMSTSYQNLDVIYSNIEHLSQEKELMNIASDSNYLANWIQDKVSDSYDFIVLDSPAATGAVTLNALVASDLIIVPIQCESLAIKSLKRFLVVFRELQSKMNANLRIAGILLTMYDRHDETHRLVCRQVYSALQDSVFKTIIPRCPHILKASALGKDVMTRSATSVGATGYIRLTNEILDRFHLR